MTSYYKVNSHAIDFPAGQDKPDLRKDIETIGKWYAKPCCLRENGENEFGYWYKNVVTKWQNDLHEAGSSMELSTAHRDGIDALVQLVDAALGTL